MDETMTKSQAPINKQRQRLIFIDNCDLVIGACLFVGHCDLDIIFLFGNCDLVIGYCPL
jgi:hypothetical protein